jgi:hypothetical protein
MTRTLRLVAVAWRSRQREACAAPCRAQDAFGDQDSERDVGLTYTVLGYALLRFMEHESRKRASLQIA